MEIRQRDKQHEWGNENVIQEFYSKNMKGNFWVPMRRWKHDIKLGLIERACKVLE